MARTSIKTGHCFEAKDPGRGVYLALSKANFRDAWWVLVLIEDKQYAHEPAGSVSSANIYWLLVECRRIA